MNEFFDFLTQNEIDGAVVIFLMIFSLGIALFQTVIFSGLFNLKFPGWLFFVLSPMLVGISFLINKSYPFAVILFLFASIFLFAIIGMVYSGIRSSKKEKEERERFNRKHNIKKTPLGKQLLGLLVGACIIAAFFYLAENGNLKLLFFIIPGFIIISNIFFPSKKSKFMRLQSILPTSKIASAAMGQVEVVGDLEEILGILQPTLSQQLTVLRAQGMVCCRREGRHAYYSVCSPAALATIRWHL